MTTSMTDARGTRLVALDAVRGIAALCVVIAHITATNAAVAAKGSPTTWPRLVTVLTPVHLLWDGPIAVTVFFVLSGFVLTLPFLRRSSGDHDPRIRWAGFYPKRLARLYLPAWAALLIAFGIMRVVASHPTVHGSAWLAHNSHRPTIHGLSHAALLVAGAGSIDGPLWSLGLEIVYSMLLPLFVLACLVRFIPEWAKWLLVIVAVTTAGAASSRSASLLCAFAFGALLASMHQRRYEAPREFPRSAFVTILVASLVGLNAGPVVNLAHLPHHLSGGVSRCVTILGATGAVFVVVSWTAASRVLSVRPLEWLGSRSFSLYLIHFPIVIGLSHLIDPTHLGLLIVIELTASLVAAELFCRLIERPSHELSKRIGRWASVQAAARLVAQPSSGSAR